MFPSHESSICRSTNPGIKRGKSYSCPRTIRCCTMKIQSHLAQNQRLINQLSKRFSVKTIWWKFSWKWNAILIRDLRTSSTTPASSASAAWAPCGTFSGHMTFLITIIASHFPSATCRTFSGHMTFFVTFIASHFRLIRTLPGHMSRLVTIKTIASTSFRTVAWNVSFFLAFVAFHSLGWNLIYRFNYFFVKSMTRIFSYYLSQSLMLPNHLAFDLLKIQASDSNFSKYLKCFRGACLKLNANLIILDIANPRCLLSQYETPQLAIEYWLSWSWNCAMPTPNLFCLYKYFFWKLPPCEAFGHSLEKWPSSPHLKHPLPPPDRRSWPPRPLRSPPRPGKQQQKLSK